MREQSSLATQEPSLPILTAQAGELKSPAEFWSALGSRLRPSVTVTVTISVQPFDAALVPIAITKEIDFEPMENPASQEEAFEIAGRVTDAASLPVDDASVLIVELGLTTRTGRGWPLQRRAYQSRKLHAQGRKAAREHAD